MRWKDKWKLKWTPEMQLALIEALLDGQKKKRLKK